MIVGFLLAAYSVVANDSIQDARHVPRLQRPAAVVLLWLFGSGILLAVLFYGWFVNDGDPAYGRLSKFPGTGGRCLVDPRHPAVGTS